MSYDNFVRTKTKKGKDILKSLNPIATDLLHASLVLSTETGELLDAVKKATIYGQPLDLTNIREELGDIEFALAMVRNTLGFSRASIIEGNMNKLNKRYPEGYSDDKAKERADKQDESTEEPSADAIDAIGSLLDHIVKEVFSKKEEVDEDDRYVYESFKERINEYEPSLIEDVGEDGDITILFNALVKPNNRIVIPVIIINDNLVESEKLEELITDMANSVMTMKKTIIEEAERETVANCHLKVSLSGTEFSIIEEKEED